MCGGEGLRPRPTSVIPVVSGTRSFVSELAMSQSALQRPSHLQGRWTDQVGCRARASSRAGVSDGHACDSKPPFPPRCLSRAIQNR